MFRCNRRNHRDLVGKQTKSGMICCNFSFVSCVKILAKGLLFQVARAKLQLFSHIVVIIKWKRFIISCNFGISLVFPPGFPPLHETPKEGIDLFRKRQVKIFPLFLDNFHGRCSVEKFYRFGIDGFRLFDNFWWWRPVKHYCRVFGLNFLCCLARAEAQQGNE